MSDRTWIDEAIQQTAASGMVPIVVIIPVSSNLLNEIGHRNIHQALATAAANTLIELAGQHSTVRPEDIFIDDLPPQETT